MTWKTTAAASGAMLAATWLASHAPVGKPREAPSDVSSFSSTASAAAEIQREADRLHGRMQQVAAYKTPARNPFRFADRSAHAPAYRPAPPPQEVAPPIQPQVPTLRVRLSGIGEDGAGDQLVRTAIISTPGDVFLVKIGDTVAKTYKVTTIEPDAVELVRLDDGSSVRLTLRR